MSEQNTQFERKEKTAQFAWTGFILLFFVLQAILWAIAITLTANDQSNAVVADYDKKALNWDDEVALRTASDRLGWQAVLHVDPGADFQRVHVITLELQNADQLPVIDANVQLTAFHRARAAEPQQIRFTEVGGGVYVGKLAVRQDGLWQFEGSAQKAGATFLINDKQLLGASN